MKIAAVIAGVVGFVLWTRLIAKAGYELGVNDSVDVINTWKGWTR